MDVSLLAHGAKTIARTKKLCTVAGCGNEARGRGLCSKHHSQILRHGSLLTRTRFDPNEILIKEDTAEVSLYNRLGEEVAKCVVDLGDADLISSHKWRLGKEGYAQTQVDRKTLRMHSLLLPRVSPIDHADRDKLNNRRNNLRPSSKTKNAGNVGLTKRNTSGFKGVFKQGDKFLAAITVQGTPRRLGVFENAESAAGCYDEGAVKIFKEYACTNKMLGLIN